ncbi:hypothetical protein CI109_105735 [Kwoniella shandongensis]|uniref:Uncharacterized protein n=1 Tax=Kwoniella shandongensis TaxID=1734106 RepID=A0A5M6C0K9_9TREE|nr:uncharacterized protein CI109_003075 [Kwoniella shandongensis]KAA5528543.1 hypothetical protein CI109_003075 [Kwoniella shandongensis]
MSSAPFTEDALNRYRITHSDRELKPLLRRLHRLPHLPAPDDYASTSDSETHDDVIASAAVERETMRMELIKWKIGVERVMGSVGNLERQKERYRKRAEETVQRTQQLRQTLAQEKEELERKRRLRDHQVKCDEVAARIASRGKSRAALDEQIQSLESSLEEHRASHGLYLQTTQSRLDTFTQITKLIEECRGLKLPVDSTNPIPSGSAGGEEMEVDSPAITTKLSAAAPPFQPTAVASVPASGPSVTSRSSTPVASSSSTLKVPASGHGLPSRPARGSAAAAAPPSGPSRTGSHTLPNRPSNLRASTTPAQVSHGSLEDGEVGPEEGEVADERGNKRAREEGSGTATRSTRSRVAK